MGALLTILVIASIAPGNYTPGHSGAAIAAPGVQGDDHFGVAWISAPGTVAGEQRTRQAVDLGIRWDRFPFYWNQMQSVLDAPIDFSQMDRVVDHDLANGIQVQGILLGAPQWAIVGGKIAYDRWYQFVYQTVLHYGDKVNYWEIWNEPDLLDGNGQGVFWWGSIEDYYELLKTGYRAVKAANPNDKVLMAAIAFPYNNQEFFPRFLDVLSRDATAAANNYYFDILPLHLYGRVSTVYDLPIGYVGKPDFPGFRGLMRGRGFEKPIWVNEAGVAVWNTGSGKNAPGRATLDEQASYVIQAFAYGLASGVEKIFVFQLYDDGAGALDPNTKLPAEYYGLISNDGEPRPAYTAYQTAARYFSGTKLATRVNYWRDGNPSVKGVDVITLYGTPYGKITLTWNYDGGATKQVRVLSNSPRAILMDKAGRQQPVTARDGAYVLDARPATNNNNFNCYTPAGCDPNDYIIGGDPTILIEPDATVPPSVVNPLPSGVNAPFTVAWRPTKALPGGARYDVQFMDPEDGVWRNWLVSTTDTSGTFGTSATPVRLNHTYVFRSRVTDASGRLIDGYDYPQNGMASTVVLGGSASIGATPPSPTPTSSTPSSPTPTVTPSPSPTPTVTPPTPTPEAAVDAKIQIVWPQGNKPVTEATRVNIGGYVFLQDTLAAVNPNWAKEVKLWRALNNGVEEQVTVGQKRTVSKGALSYPVWDFNDVDVSQARDPLNKYYFRLSVAGTRSFGNIWSHGADARTYFPKTDVPSGITSGVPAAVDAKIEIVWPQGNLPVDKAVKANVGVYIFEKGTLKSVPTGFSPVVRLWRALNNDAMREIAVGKKETKTEKGITYPVWVFNDVDVSAARDKLSKYYFYVTVDGVTSSSNIWSHGVDARTYFPTPEEPRTVSGR
ncbi:MAG: hypothetical protein HYY30_14870 [Chloroflexi bacterium]|nr:hypothetical protein [Chloroflexota bacterium]